MTERKCINCDYVREHERAVYVDNEIKEYTYFKCHRYPPRVLESTRYGTSQPSPFVEKDDWCGEFRPKKYEVLLWCCGCKVKNFYRLDEGVNDITCRDCGTKFSFDYKKDGGE